MAWHCESCNKSMDSAQSDPNTNTWRCPDCGAEVRLSSTQVAPPSAAAGVEAEAAAENADTVFQPALMMESIMDELSTESSPAEGPASGGDGTEPIEADPKALPPPYLQIDLEAYLLVLGAQPGQERRPLSLAKTVFGRQGADVPLDDPAVSGSHFQIEAFGKEFFLRDLESRNGTFLNGVKVRYSQLLPGDQITAGKTSLIFRTSDDLIDRG